MINLVDIWKSYKIGEINIPVLRGITLEINEGAFIAIMGASGSGKSTLLNIIGCLDQLDYGSYKMFDKQIETAGEDDLAKLRLQNIGFIFQQFHLIPRISALRNVELPMIYGGISTTERSRRALEMLDHVGIADRSHHTSSQLSGGQQQRVAIARALVNRPRILVADEPTGSLDSRTSKEIMSIISKLNKNGMTIIMVTHEADVAAYASKIIYLNDGKIAYDADKNNI